MLTPELLESLTDQLDAALQSGRECTRLTLQMPDLSLDDAYAIQAAGIERRVARGERITGYKMGLTSKAKRDQMNLNSPVYGVLTDRMQVADNGPFSLSFGIHPKIEPEIAFLIGAPLSGHVTREQVRDACMGVAAALEILDSRYVGFKYFSLPDVIADNCSSSHYILSSQMFAADMDVGDLAMAMAINGTVVQSASSAAISGHPLDSVVQLCAMLAEHGKSLMPGQIVLAGAATLAEALSPGLDVSLDVESLGRVSVRMA